MFYLGAVILIYALGECTIFYRIIAMKRIFLIFFVIIAAILVLALARSYSAGGNAEDSQRPSMAVKQQMSSAKKKAPVVADSSHYSVVKGLTALLRISKKAEIDLCDL